MRKRLPLFCLFLLHALLATAQSASLHVRGVPGLTHYQRKDFKADPQFWSVCEDRDGVMYFGNNDGVLIFDGERWQKVQLPNSSSVRSLITDAQGRVHAGGYNEFGLVKKDSTGRYYYASLPDSLQVKDRNFENIWQIHALKDFVFYRSFHKLMAVKGSTLAELPANSTFLRSFSIGDELFVLDKERGLMELDMEKLQFTTRFSAQSLQHAYIMALLPGSLPHQLLAFANNGAVYLLDRQAQTVTLWKNLFVGKGEDQILHVIKSQQGVYYIGTLSSGIVAMNEAGEVLKDQQHFQGLQDKTVLDVYQTKTGNLWALLNRGLDFINFNSPVSTLFENASIYDVLLKQDKLYLATNQGLFYTRLGHQQDQASNLQFEKIKGSEGQVWSLRQVSDDVLCSHDRGLFKVNEGEISRIGEIEGIWKVIPAAERMGIYLACSYNGLYLLERSDETGWKVIRKIMGFNESSRDIIAGDTPGTYWICHGYKGVYRIKLDPDLSRVTSMEHFSSQNGLPSPFNINVSKWEGTIVFTTNQGIYTYHEEKNRFVPFAPLNKLLGIKANTRKLLQFGDKTWFVHDDEVGYFNTREANPALQKELFLQFKGTFNKGMECIVPLDEQRVLFGTTLGLYLFNFSRQSADQKVATHISSIRYTLNKEEHALPLQTRQHLPIQLPHNTSTLRFEFAAPGMLNNTHVQYSYILENIDEGWSDWKSNAFKEYTHLRPGHYTFKVRSRSLLGVNGSESRYHFEIMPVWYQTPWAWAVYFVLASLLLVLLVYLIDRKIRYENNKTREEEQKARKLLELEIEQMKLQTEKERIRQEKEQLEEDVIYKSKELANYTMLLVKKREVFAELIQELRLLRDLAKTDATKSKLRELVKMISSHLSDEEHLQVFETNFEQIHHHFFTTLRELYPELNQRELRLCAFVKMNLSNKEISPLLNISVRGVETARYRIRKKLNLEYEHNLVEFLESLSPAETEQKSDNSTP